MAFQSDYRPKTDTLALRQTASSSLSDVQDAPSPKLRRPEATARLLQPKVQAKGLEQGATIDLQSILDGLHEDRRAQDGQPRGCQALQSGQCRAAHASESGAAFGRHLCWPASHWPVADTERA